MCVKSLPVHGESADRCGGSSVKETWSGEWAWQGRGGSGGLHLLPRLAGSTAQTKLHTGIERAKKWGHIFQNGGNRSSSRCDFDKWLLFSLTCRLLFHTGPHAWRSWASVSYFKHKISFALKTVSLSTNRPSVGHKRSSLKLSTGMTVTPEPPTFTHERECFFFYTLKNKCQVELLIWCLGARGYWITDVTNIWLLDVVIVYKGMWISVHYSYL